MKEKELEELQSLAKEKEQTARDAATAKKYHMLKFVGSSILLTVDIDVLERQKVVRKIKKYLKIENREPLDDEDIKKALRRAREEWLYVKVNLSPHSSPSHGSTSRIIETISLCFRKVKIEIPKPAKFERSYLQVS